MEFVWDRDKATQNQAKHGVSFPEATTVFDDSFSVAVPDPDHSFDEARYIIVGASQSVLDGGLHRTRRTHSSDQRAS